MRLQLLDKDGAVELEDLTDVGIQDARYQCERMIERLNELANQDDED